MLEKLAEEATFSGVGEVRVICKLNYTLLVNTAYQKPQNPPSTALSLHKSFSSDWVSICATPQAKNLRDLET